MAYITYLQESGAGAAVPVNHDVALDDNIAVTFVRIVGGIFHIAPGLFDFALDLLRCALNLSACVPGPLANLAFCATGGIINCTLYLVLVHRSTSVD
jgi:hypothetical protein